MNSVALRAASTAAAIVLVAMAIEAAVSARLVPSWERVGAIPVEVMGCRSDISPCAPVSICEPLWRAVDAPPMKEGSVVLSCAVDERGRFANCATISEEPAGTGLGYAAIEIMEGKQARREPGRAVARHCVEVSVYLHQPPPPPPDLIFPGVGLLPS